MNLPMIGLVIVVIAIVTLVAVDSLGDGVMDERWAIAAAMAALLLVIGGGTLGDYRGRIGTAGIHILIWVAIGLALALIYTWREPLKAAFGA
jgi:hypothetical protein